jgi:amino-acid N-acetyltransferase
LKHFKARKPVAGNAGDTTSEMVRQAKQDSWRLQKTGVNLGNLYIPARAIEQSPVFTRENAPERIPQVGEPLHIALVKLRWPQGLDKETLGGIALTLSQLVGLGLNIAVVLDCDAEEVAEGPKPWDKSWETGISEQVGRVLEALNEYNEPGAMVVEHALGVENVKHEVPTTVHVRGGVEVKNHKLLLPLLEDGVIPVIPPISYTAESLEKRRVEPDDVILALTREFAGITAKSILKPVDQTYDFSYDQHKPLLDRIIILDPVGGIPCKNRPDNAHVFLNLEQEYRGVRNELTDSNTPPRRKAALSLLGGSNPFSKFAEINISTPQYTPAIPSRHTKNLDVVQRALKLLPTSSSALIISPTAAAVSSRPQPDEETAPTGVRTRRPKNPLIHNLLTDKPMVSSSLPDDAIPTASSLIKPTANTPTFLKKGIPVTIIPATPWKPPSPSDPSISLENDPRIDFPRLLDLIEDSFQRKLDVRAYLERIRGRVAGVIIAGDYEGGAICTWEHPSPSSDALVPIQQPIPYLDKFAVRTTSQGSGGVADIVWRCLTRQCFPDGVLWRSRANNPVNKWYSERSVGTWKLPGGQWSMFWTTEGVVEEWAKAKDNGMGEETQGKWNAYVKVCEGVVPTWTDGKRPD